MERERFLTILRELQDVCMEVNSELAGTENGKVMKFYSFRIWLEIGIVFII